MSIKIRPVLLAVRDLTQQGSYWLNQRPIIIKLRTWYADLQPREKTLVRIAAIVSVAYLCYLVILMPIITLVRSTDKNFAQAEADLLWLQQQARIVTGYKNQGLRHLDTQQVIQQSRRFFQQSNLNVALSSIQRNQELLITIHYSGNRPSSFFSALSKMINLGITLDQLSLNQAEESNEESSNAGQVNIQVNMMY